MVYTCQPSRVVVGINILFGYRIDAALCCLLQYFQFGRPCVGVVGVCAVISRQMVCAAAEYHPSFVVVMVDRVPSE